MRRNPKIKKASAVTPATKHKLHNGAYRKAIPLSRLIQIGGLLLLLDGKHHPNGWTCLEELLRQFYDGGVF